MVGKVGELVKPARFEREQAVFKLSRASVEGIGACGKLGYAVLQGKSAGFDFCEIIGDDGRLVV